MKNTICLFIAFFCWFNLSASNFSELSDSATNYYLESDFDNALIIYNSLLDQDYTSSELFYNIANCYYNIGDITNAIYFFEKSLLLSPNDADAKHNLELAKLQLRDKLENKQELFYQKWYNSLISLCSSEQWAYTSVIIFILALAVFSVYLFSRRIYYKKLGFTLALIFLIISIFTNVFARQKAELIINNNNAIVFERSLVKASPSEAGQNLFEINKGLKVELLDSINLWVNIKLSDGKQGWIKKEYIKGL